MVRAFGARGIRLHFAASRHSRGGRPDPHRAARAAGTRAAPPSGSKLGGQLRRSSAGRGRGGRCPSAGMSRSGDMQSGVARAEPALLSSHRAQRGASIPRRGIGSPHPCVRARNASARSRSFSARPWPRCPPRLASRCSASASCSLSVAGVEVLGRDRLLDQEPGVVAEHLQPAVGLGVAHRLGVADVEAQLGRPQRRQQRRVVGEDADLADRRSGSRPGAPRR